MPMSMYEVSDLRETENRLPELYPDLPGPIGPYGVVRAVARGVLFGNGLMGAPLYWFWFANGNPGVPAWRAHLVVSHEAYLDDFDSGDPRRVASRTEFTRRDMLTLAGMLDGTYTDRDFGFEHPYERVVHEALRVIEECGGASLFASYRLESAIGLYVSRVRGRCSRGPSAGPD